MSDILRKILATKREEVASARATTPLAELRARAAAAPPVRDFVGAIRTRHAAQRPAVIAEIKRASPSAGVFRAPLEGAAFFSPGRFADSYARNGAACLSVLTDRGYFQGSPQDLIEARAACTLPVLRKDFIVDAYQIVEARAMGADAVLFIMGAAPIETFRTWEGIAHELGLAVLAESHTGAELAEALTLKTPLIGINNRDLTRFETDLQTTLKLKSHVPDGRIIITESGIASPADVARMQLAGVTTYLIGGALMEKADPGVALGQLFHNYPLT